MSAKGAIVTNVVGAQATSASTTDTEIEIIGTTTRLLRIVRMRSSQAFHKTSEMYQMQLERHTGTGTGTAYTPMLKEPNSGAVGFTAKINDTVEPTYAGLATSILVSAAVNSLTGRDIVLPPGQEIYIAPSATNGVGLAVKTPSGTTASTTYIQEMELEEIG